MLPTLKTKHDKLLSNFAFNFNMRPYTLLSATRPTLPTQTTFFPRWGAVQLDPGLTAVDPTLAFRDFQRLKLKHDELLSNFGFNRNLRPSTKDDPSFNWLAMPLLVPPHWWGGAG